jgi:hypothetical protein
MARKVIFKNKLTIKLVSGLRLIPQKKSRRSGRSGKISADEIAKKLGKVGNMNHSTPL